MNTCPKCHSVWDGVRCLICGYLPGEEENKALVSDHYREGKIECIEYMFDTMTPEAFSGYLEGCAKKYMHRWRYKGNEVKDLRKARDYITALIDYKVNPSKCPKFKEFK